MPKTRTEQLDHEFQSVQQRIEQMRARGEEPPLELLKQAQRLARARLDSCGIVIGGTKR